VPFTLVHTGIYNRAGDKIIKKYRQYRN